LQEPDRGLDVGGLFVEQQKRSVCGQNVATPQVSSRVPQKSDDVIKRDKRDGDRGIVGRRIRGKFIAHGARSPASMNSIKRGMRFSSSSVISTMRQVICSFSFAVGPQDVIRQAGRIDRVCHKNVFVPGGSVTGYRERNGL